MARLPRRVRRLWEYALSERRTFRQGLVALALSTLAGFVAGLTLSHLAGGLAELPGLLVLIPAAVGMKGTIFGAFGARLGTAEAAGLLTASLERGSVLRRNVDAAILMTFSSSLWLAALARVAAAAFGADALPLWKYLLISIVGGLLGTVVILVLAVTLARLGSRRGWDLDAVFAPLIMALGDMTMLPSLFVATLLLRSDAVAVPVAAIATAVAIAATVRLYVARDGFLRRVALEMTPTILLTPFLDVLAGVLLDAREGQLVAVPVLLALIPPFVSQAGALGGIFASRTTSKLRLGVLTPRGLPELPAVVDAVVTAVLAVITFALIGALAWLIGTATGLDAVPALGTLLRGTLLAGLVLVPIVLVGAYELAIVTYRFGLDPDNQGVPTITSVADLAGVVMVLAVMTSSGVLPHG